MALQIPRLSRSNLQVSNNWRKLRTSPRQHHLVGALCLSGQAQVYFLGLNRRLHLLLIPPPTTTRIETCIAAAINKETFTRCPPIPQYACASAPRDRLVPVGSIESPRQTSSWAPSTSSETTLCGNTITGRGDGAGVERDGAGVSTMISRRSQIAWVSTLEFVNLSSASPSPALWSGARQTRV